MHLGNPVYFILLFPSNNKISLERSPSRHSPAKIHTFPIQDPHKISPPRNSQRKGVYPYQSGAGSARPNPKMGAPDPENPLFLGFSVLRGGLRPWSQTMVSEGARPWGRGRSGDCEIHLQKSRFQPIKRFPRKFNLGKLTSQNSHFSNEETLLKNSPSRHSPPKTHT